MFCYSSGYDKLRKLFGEMLPDFLWHNKEIDVEQQDKSYQKKCKGKLDFRMVDVVQITDNLTNKSA
jgi:hypothetical protein